MIPYRGYSTASRSSGTESANTSPSRPIHGNADLFPQLIVIHLLDSLTLSRPTLYISSLLLCLRSMLHLPFPLVNVLTKIDNLAKTTEPLPFNLDYYTEVQDLDYMLPHLEAEQNNTTVARSQSAGTHRLPESKFTALNRALISLISDFGLIGFETLAVEDKLSMSNLIHAIDRASGYVFGTEKGANDSVWQIAMQEGWGGKIDVRDVQERWIDRREEFDEMERLQSEHEAKERGPQGGPEVRRVDPERTEEQNKDMEKLAADLEHDEDLEAMQNEFLAAKDKQKDSGIKVVRKTLA